MDLLAIHKIKFMAKKTCQQDPLSEFKLVFSVNKIMERASNGVHHRRPSRGEKHSIV